MITDIDHWGVLHKVKTLPRMGAAMAVAAEGEENGAWVIGLTPYPMLCRHCRVIITLICPFLVRA